MNDALMLPPLPIYEDSRPIRAVFDHESDELARVGKGGVARILSYAEPGDMSPKSAIAVYRASDRHPWRQFILAPGWTVEFEESTS